MPSTTSPMYPSPTLCTTTPSRELDLVRSLRAAADGRYCTRSVMSRTACRVARLIAGSAWSARLTVAVDTPRAAATSFIVTRFFTGATSLPGAQRTGPGQRRTYTYTFTVAGHRRPQVNRLQVKRLHDRKPG